MLARLLLLVAGAGLTACTVFLGLVAVAAVRFKRAPRSRAIAPASLPPVTLLKPLCGLEPDLEANLESFFRQDYSSYEIVFGARTADDAGLTVARRISARYPEVPVQFVFAGEPEKPNAKVCSLEKMMAAAQHDFLVISDSDVRVTPQYAREVTAPLLNARVGLVTCLYRGVPTGGIWSRLEALGMSVEMTSGVIVANMLEGMRFALGPTMATRREVLEDIGGLSVLADYCADDYVLGLKVFESGREVVLSRHVVDHVVLNRGFKDSVLHQVRWMKSTRFSRPKGHVGSGLTFAMPFGLLALGAGILAHNLSLGIGLFGWAVLNRMLMAAAAGGAVTRDPLSLLFGWIYPVRDLMGFCFWVASFLGTSIVWRRERYRLLPGGLMVRLAQREDATASAMAVNTTA